MCQNDKYFISIILQNWFHVKSEWQENSEIFTLWFCNVTKNNCIIQTKICVILAILAFWYLTFEGHCTANNFMNVIYHIFNHGSVTTSLYLNFEWHLELFVSWPLAFEGHCEFLTIIPQITGHGSITTYLDLKLECYHVFLVSWPLTFEGHCQFMMVIHQIFNHDSITTNLDQNLGSFVAISSTQYYPCSLWNGEREREHNLGGNYIKIS